MRISDWSSDVCSSDLERPAFEGRHVSFRDVVFEPKPVQKPHLPIWFGGDADAVLKRIARYASGWWPFLTKTEGIPGRLDFIRSQPDYNGRLDEVVYGFATTRVGDRKRVGEGKGGAGRGANGGGRISKKNTSR